MKSSPEAGFRKTSLVDYPGLVTSVLFFPGCNFRCPWCHNPELVLPSPRTPSAGNEKPGKGGDNSGFLPLDDCLDVIEKRKHLIQGVVLTGGEALLSEALGPAIRRIHGMGLLVKLDTNGSLPGKLDALAAEAETRPDFVALDLKTSPEAYRRIGPGEPFNRVTETLRLLESSKIGYELRTVVVPGFFDVETLDALAPFVPDETPWFFSPFSPGNCLDPAYDLIPPPSSGEVKEYAARASAMGKNAIVR